MATADALRHLEELHGQAVVEAPGLQALLLARRCTVADLLGLVATSIEQSMAPPPIQTAMTLPQDTLPLSPPSKAGEKLADALHASRSSSRSSSRSPSSRRASRSKRSTATKPQTEGASASQISPPPAARPPKPASKKPPKLGSPKSASPKGSNPNKPTGSRGNQLMMRGGYEVLPHDEYESSSDYDGDMSFRSGHYNGSFQSVPAGTSGLMYCHLKFTASGQVYGSGYGYHKATDTDLSFSWRGQCDQVFGTCEFEQEDAQSGDITVFSGKKLDSVSISGMWHLVGDTKCGTFLLEKGALRDVKEFQGMFFKSAVAAAIASGHLDHPDAIWAPQGGVFKSGHWHGSYVLEGATEVTPFTCRLQLDKKTLGATGTGVTQEGGCFQVSGSYQPSRPRGMELLLSFFDGGKMLLEAADFTLVTARGGWCTQGKHQVKRGSFELKHGRDPVEHALLVKEFVEPQLSSSVVTLEDTLAASLRSRSGSSVSGVTTSTVSMPF